MSWARGPSTSSHRSTWAISWGWTAPPFKSRRGELSLLVREWKLLAKSLRDVPKEYYGIEDVETRYRHRELDLLANADARELFILRTKVVQAIRRWLDERGFLEVEAPILQPLYGGALARPFVTHHNELDRELYLRIADELYLKRLIVGGLERVYEIGKDFRNEGVSHKHNPEFTMLEWYEAYADYTDIAARLEELIAHVAREVGYDGPGEIRRLGAASSCATQSRRRRVSTSGATTCPARARGPSAWTGCFRSTWSRSSSSPRSSSTIPRSCRRSRKITARSRAWSSASSASRGAWSSPTPSRS